MIGDPTVLIVPGWMGSGPQHRQTYWEQKHLDYRRLTLDDWRSVHREDWILGLEKALITLGGNVVLVAHGLGCLSVAWWAATDSPLLPASRRPCWSRLRISHRLPALSSFTPIPQRELPFPSLLVASETDPYATIQAAAAMAQHWGSTLVNAGAAGHINADSGHGDGPEGERYLTGFLDAVTLQVSGGEETAAGRGSGTEHPAPNI
jgi:uncharacterized protein